MRNDLATRHLNEEEMVLLLDRELPRRRYAQAREHVRTCWTCQARFAELKSVTAEIVRLDTRLATLAGNGRDSGDGDGVWPDLLPRLRETRRELDATASRGWAATPSWTRLALAIAAMASLALGYTLITRWNRPVTPVVSRPTAPARPAGSPEHKTVPFNPAATSSAPPAVPHTGPLDSAPIGAELSVVVALHRVGADTGEPVKVTATSDGGVRVDGNGLPEERETEIRAALAGLPKVTARFEHLAVPQGKIPQPESPLTFTTRRRAFAGVLEAAAGAPGLEALTNGLLDESEEMMASAHALHHLAERFPVERRRGMNAAELAALAQIEADHTAGVRTHFRRIEALLEPLRSLLADGGGAASQGTDAGLFDCARQVQRAINAIFGGDDPQQPLAAALAELARANRQMDRALEAAK